MATQAARFVGSIPENYDAGLGPHIFNGYADDLARRVSDLGPQSVLELAAGTGIVTRKLRDALADGCDLVATDLNQPMLEVAKTKFDAGESVRFEAVDATELTFAPDSFDIVVCQFGVMFFPDKPRSYTEAQRVLKPGGHYVFNVWDSWEVNPFAQITHQAVEALFPDDPPGFYKVPFGYHDVDEIKGALLAAGFDRVQVERVPLTSSIPVAADFAKGLVFGNPLFEEVINRGGDPQQVCEQVEAALQAQLGAQMGLQAVVFEASKD